MGLSSSLSLELPYPDALKMPIPNEMGWSGVTLPWMSTGYEMALTPIHMLTFYNAIANGGKMMKPIFTTSIESKGVELIKKPSEVISSSICSESTIKKIIPLLTGVVSQGTAKNIYSDKYKISGKTGTAVLNYANRKEGEIKMYQASFVGFFPSDDPKYSCIVVINKPKNGKIYGGQIAAPVFRELADKVYALDINIHSAITSSEIIKSMPILKLGDVDKIDLVLNRLNIPNKSISASYLIRKNSEEEVILNDRRILEYLNKGLMPDLTGINLQDALFVLENYGMKVIVSGFGSVIRQSVQKGDKVKKGTEIEIELA
jgi:cell division protein FtsI (penicillin-binding protein 3)